MRKALYALTTALALTAMLAFLAPTPQPGLRMETDADTDAPHKKGPSHEEDEEGRIPMRTRMDLAAALEFEKTVDPASGTVPRERLAAAKAYADQLRAAKITAAIPGVTWRERGPNNVSGRTRAILIDPNTPSGLKVFAAGVAGGLWVTNDISAATPVWTPIDEFMANLAVCALAADPSNPLVMYAGTGEGYFNSDATRGLGIFKSVNGGATWTQLASTNNANFYNNQRIAVTATGVVLTATSTGVRRSTDGGTTWTKVLGAGLGITGAVSNLAWDVEIAANGDVYGTIDGSIHKSVNGGATWGAALTLPIAVARVELAAAPSDANYLYALCENGNVVAGILRSTDAGATWTVRTEPDDADGGIPATDFSRGQAWYDLSIAVDPNNRDRLFVGGVDLFGSTDGAATWTQVAHWYGGFGFQYVHADQHIALFQPGSSSICYFGNDGGVYRTTNANAVTPTIAFKGDNYNVTQFYACAIHPTALTDYFLAGAQDNGSQQFNSAGIDATIEVTGGDGAFVHIDQDQPQYQFTSYVYNDYYRSADGGVTWASASSSGGRFINPTDYDNLNNRMYCARNANEYLRWDNPQTGATFTTVAVAAFGGQVSAVTVSPNTANRVFFGANGDFFRVDNAHTATPTVTNLSTGLPAAYLNCIEVETGNDNHLLVTYTNYGVNSIWESVNGGTSWTSVEGNLPDMPIRWALFNPLNTDQAMVATELGAWTTDNLNGGTTNWGASNSGFANTRVEMLQMRTSDNLVIAATHGRGLYSSDAFTNPTALFTAANLVEYTTRPVQFTDGSYRATSWSYNFGDGSPLSTLQNPSHPYANPARYTCSLTINGGASSLNRNNYVHILPDRGTPYAPANGGNFETNIDDFGQITLSGTNWQRGNSAVAGKNGTQSPTNAWVTGLVGNYVDNTTAYLFSPSFNFTSPGTYTLRFYHKYAVENQYDGHNVEYTTNKGVTWNVLGTAGAGWYNFANGAGGTAFPAGVPFFTGTVAAFTQMNRDVSFLAGNSTVAFRFVFKTDPGVTGAGLAIDDFEILGPVNPGGLPVEWSPLAGTWLAERPSLTWTTMVEANMDRFVIERSIDGVNFQQAGEVEAMGTQGQGLDYAWEDPAAPLSHYYYRLRAIDLDGSFQYSNTVELSKANDYLLGLDAFPNPFADDLSLNIRGPQGAPVTISCYDAAGKLLFERDGLDHVGALVRLRLTDLRPGAYLLRVRAGGETVTRRVVKQ